MTRLILIIGILFIQIFANCNSSTASNAENVKAEECNLSQDVKDDIAKYAGVVNNIINYFVRGDFKGETWKRMSYFADKFGSRISGSQALEDSIDFLIAESIKTDLENIHTHNVTVPHWVRGKESATLIKPRLKKMHLLGLGRSISTPPEGITAKVVVVKSFDELDALVRSDVAGKIVVYDQPYTTYGRTVPYRNRGAVEAAKKGAVAALVRSVTPFSIGSPHTGDQTYDDDVQKIPIAAITLEDADLLRRLQDRNVEIEVNLKLSSTEDTKISRNLITDLIGSEQPEKIVVVSGHIDSWDVGDGSMDDTSGCFISWLAPIALKKLNLRPKRTLRNIFFTSEEFGYIGAIAYEKDNRKDNDNLNFVMESDFGTFKPLGLLYQGSKDGECMMREILKLFVSINATQLVLDRPGSDITVWTDQEIPGGGLLNDDRKYFWFHHAEGDALNVLDPDTMDLNSAFWTAVSYVIADMKYDIPRSGAYYHNQNYYVLIFFVSLLFYMK